MEGWRDERRMEGQWKDGGMREGCQWTSGLLANRTHEICTHTHM